MRKYWQIIKTTWIQYSIYRLNFLIWRLRSFIGFIIIYFFWQTIFSQNSQLLGWQQFDLLTYVFGVAFLRSIIFSSRTIDVGGEINSGNLTNYLLKPLSFLKFWFASDLGDKILNLVFTVLELFLFFLILKPALFWQTDLFYLTFFLLSIILAIILYFYLNLWLGFLAFWTPESWSGVWGPRFVFMIILEFFGGTIFPLDLLPKTVFNLLRLTPFPYFIYFPLKIYLGKIDFQEMITGFAITIIWCFLWYLIIQKTWQQGLKVYGAEGR